MTKSYSKLTINYNEHTSCNYRRQEAVQARHGRQEGEGQVQGAGRGGDPSPLRRFSRYLN